MACPSSDSAPLTNLTWRVQQWQCQAVCGDGHGMVGYNDDYLMTWVPSIIWKGWLFGMLKYVPNDIQSLSNNSVIMIMMVKVC